MRNHHYMISAHRLLIVRRIKQSIENDNRAHRRRKIQAGKQRNGVSAAISLGGVAKCIMKAKSAKLMFSERAHQLSSWLWKMKSGAQKRYDNGDSGANEVNDALNKTLLMPKSIP